MTPIKLRNKVKAWLLRLFNRSFPAVLSVKTLYIFIVQMMGWIILVCILALFAYGLFLGVALAFGKTLQISDLILFITAVFILAYTYETKKLRQESVFQRKMSVASDIHFRMNSTYGINDPGNTELGKLKTVESSNNISQFEFLKAMPMRAIGHCSTFIKYTPEDKFLEAAYFLPTEQDRKDFLRALQLQDGEIKAWVLVTNGNQFVYTFRAVGDNWKKTLEGAPNLKDDFILVKKELSIDEV